MTPLAVTVLVLAVVVPPTGVVTAIVDDHSDRVPLADDDDVRSGGDDALDNDRAWSLDDDDRWRRRRQTDRDRHKAGVDDDRRKAHRHHWFVGGGV